MLLHLLLLLMRVLDVPQPMRDTISDFPFPGGLDLSIGLLFVVILLSEVGMNDFHGVIFDESQRAIGQGL